MLALEDMKGIRIRELGTYLIVAIILLSLLRTALWLLFPVVLGLLRVGQVDGHGLVPVHVLQQLRVVVVHVVNNHVRHLVKNSFDFIRSQSYEL